MSINPIMNTNKDTEEGVNTVKADQEEKMKKFMKDGTPPMLLGPTTAFLMMYLVMSDTLDFSKMVSTGINELPDIQSRIGYVFKFCIPGVIWIVRCLAAVMWIRSRSPAMDPTAGSEDLVQNAKNILNNSFEQFFLSLVSQLALVQYLDSECTVKYIPALSITFLIGRITFWLGYPKYRLFGFLLNFTALFVTVLYTNYKLIVTEIFN